MSDNDEVLLSPVVAGKRTVRVYLGVAERVLGGFLLLLNRYGLLASVPKGFFNAFARLRPVPKELIRGPFRGRFTVSRDGKILAALSLDCEGDYYSSMRSSSLFAKKFLELGVGGLPTGVHNVEDLLQFRDLRGEMEAFQLYVRPMAAG